MSSYSRYVCWEWRRDDGGFSPYVPNDSSALEAAYNASKPQHTIGGYVVCFASMTQSGRGNTRSVKRNIFTLPTTSSPTTTQDIKHYWAWSDSPGHFIPYQMEASLDIERVFQQGISTVNLAQQPSRLPYTVDFQHMYQTRHHYNTKRGIQRFPLPTGTTLHGLLKEKPTALGVAGGSGFGQPLGMNSVGHMTPPHSYAGNSLGLLSTTATTYQSGYTAPPPPPLGATSVALGTSHLGHAPSIGISGIGHTPHGAHTSTSHYGNTSSSYGNTPSSISGHAPSSISGHTHINIKPMVSSNTVSNSSMSTSLSLSGTTLPSARPGFYSSHNDPPSASTRSKSGSRTKTVASKLPKSTQGKAGAKPKGKTKRKKTPADGASSNSVGGASNSPVGGAYGDDALLVYAKRLDRLKPKHDEPCPICMNKLSETSGFEDDDPSPTTTPPNTPNVYKLRKCAHRLHYSCLSMYIKNSAKNGFQCPTCKKPYGVRTGDMPSTGTMHVHTQRGSLPGHEGHGIIQITYNFTPGHHNGKHYRANGFPRTCYLPDSPKGNGVLKLLRVAWDRKLTFTIGTSVTTGAVDTVVWNEIHHKTECGSNHSGHGYPDPYYLERVMLELSAQGVVEGEKEEPEEESSSESSDDDEEPAAGSTKPGKGTYRSSSDSL